MPIPKEKLTNRFLVITKTDKMPRHHVACFLRPSTVLNLNNSNGNNYSYNNNRTDIIIITLITIIILRATSTAMQDIGLQWNPKKCNVIHVRRGKQVEDAADLKFHEATLLKNLEAGSSYKFLGVKESTLQDEKLALAVATKVYHHRLSVIWTSPLFDANRVKATNQFALPVLTYPMWTQHCPLAELREIDRETRKLASENGGKHLLSSTAVFYLSRVVGGRGMKSVEHEYKMIKIKAAIKLYMNPDPMMRSVRVLQEGAAERGFA